MMKNRTITFILFGALLTVSPFKCKHAPSEKGYLGVYKTEVKDVRLPGSSNTRKGLVIRVVRNSPAARADLKNGDIITGVDGSSFNMDKSEVFAYFKKYVSSKKPGYSLRLTLMRDNRKIEGEAVLGKGFDDIIKGKPEIPGNSDIFPGLEKYSDNMIKAMEKTVKELKLDESYNDLLGRFKMDEEWNDKFRLDVQRYIHRDPVKIEKLTTGITSGISSSLNKSRYDLPGVLRLLCERLDIPLNLFKPVKLQSGISLEAHVDQIKNLMKQVKIYSDTAFSSFSKSEKSFFFNNLFLLMDSFKDVFGLFEHDNWKVIRELIRLSYNIDFASLMKAALVTSSIADPAYISGFKADITRFMDTSLSRSKMRRAGSIIYRENTDLGEIVIGGGGNNRYEGNIAVIIDPGGNDLYTGNAGGVFSMEQPLSFVLDFSGNDRYSPAENGSAGSGRMGTGMLLDIEGDDVYSLKSCAAGCGAAGTGILIDLAGNDSYRGDAYTAGAGLWGIGIIFDSSGDDSYSSAIFSQGSGLPRGIGLIRDASGNDKYFAGGKYPSSYGEKGIYRGFSQGAGIGFRAISSGGIGILSDAGGNDSYKAGNFSQGCGYSFGWGIFHDEGNGNDYYAASRYGLSAAAHSGISSFIEEGGDDIYRGIMGVVNSAAWDLSVSLFIDRMGNDTYDTGGGFSLGASAHNGYAIFIDSGGKDSYSTSGLPGTSGSNHYHGGTSFSFFVDENSSIDIYNSKEIGNRLQVNGGNGVFLDINTPLADILKLKITDSLDVIKTK